MIQQNIRNIAQVLFERLELPQYYLDMNGHTNSPDDHTFGRLDDLINLRE